MGSENFDRQYRLAAGPYGGEGFEVGGTQFPLHVSFSFEKSDLKTQNTGKIEIWNLNEEHIAMLEAEECALTIRAGYGSRMALIFAGTVSFCKTERDNADMKTTIEVIDNLIPLNETYVSVSYEGRVGWDTIINDVADQIGVVPQMSYNCEFGEVANGFSYVGVAKNVLTKGCECSGLSWSVQNGVLQVKKDGDSIDDSVYILSEETGMIGSPERVSLSDSNSSKKEGSSKSKDYGWDVTFFMNGAINVNDYVRLESKYVTGYFYVKSISINGDNVSGDWTCKARLMEIKN